MKRKRVGEGKGVKWGYQNFWRCTKQEIECIKQMSKVRISKKVEVFKSKDPFDLLKIMILDKINIFVPCLI